MDLHKFIGETLKINEQLFSDKELKDEEPVDAAVEGPVDAPAEGPVDAPAEDAMQAPEVNDELIASLENDVPGLAGVDREELKKGLMAEMDHLDTVGGDVTMVAKITLDHMNEFPGQKYYTALEQLESELSQAAEQEGAPAPVADPAEAAPAEEVTEEPAVAAEEPVVDEEVPAEEPVDAEEEETAKK